MVNSRTKGHSEEREIARQFQELGYEAITTRAARGGDFSTTDYGIDILGTDPFKVQVKRYREYVPVNRIEEIVCDRDKGDIPLLLTKADHKPRMAVMYINDLAPLLKTIGFEKIKFGIHRRNDYVPVSTVMEIECDRDFGWMPVCVTAADTERDVVAILYWDDLKKLLQL